MTHMAKKKGKKMKRLYRSDDRLVGGVCGGIGEYYQVDPTLIRLFFVLFIFLTGIVLGILAYLAAWVIIPER